MKIAIIGRPNVGKSTLFNRLVKEKNAIVGDFPGITRDRKVHDGELWGLKFLITDTPGVDPFSSDSLGISMNKQSLAAIRESNIVFFVIDAREGVTNYDQEIASWLRSSFKTLGNRPVILIENKSEGKKSADVVETLGFGEGVALSAEHNLGMDELYQRLQSLDIPAISLHQKDLDSGIKIAIVGRPNVGKSTLINAIIGDDRLLTGEQAGITRDAILLKYKFKNRPLTLMDTAGQRRKSKVTEKLETVSVQDAWRYIRQANVVVVLMDLKNPLENQDISIASKAFDEGKIVIFAFNKSDTVENAHEILKNIQKRVEKEFAQLPGVACLLVSAKEKKGLARIFNVSFQLYDDWCKRISTSSLNKWFPTAIAKNPPPLVNGMPIKLKYISQTNTKPPTFVIFANRAEHLPVSYERYLLNNLRSSFNLYGIPLRLFVRQRQNPHDPNA
ncbi:MAG: ribosome biogenesis GTPase Der [Holosporaceae bacterium]|jgi:GTP-binding protein|nr:ribosome biogenesis GTPase Der [Holosporaceae bacterium]